MTKENLIDCHNRIKLFIHNTPVLTSSLVNNRIDAEVYFKCENFQKGGAYKMRGATNAIMLLSQEQKQKGVVTHSSGNFAQALSLAAKNLGVKATIVMPSNSPQVKKNAVIEYGGQIIECEPTTKARQSTADNIVNNTGATFIHPSNDPNVILGQGTASIELLYEQPNLDAIFCPVGGGGLIAGSALATHYFGNNCHVFGGEPLEADDAYRSLISGKIESNKTTNTIADGLRTQLGHHNFPIIQKHVNSIFRVSEIEIIEAMRFIWERMKIIIEPSSAVAFAAVLKEKKQFKNNKIGIIISGGNVDVNNLPFNI
ncbi:pyridoxal-phosphate dependent enzyme [Psychroserpens sp. AS72]|uniref:pyridoxal-phosphate dependent enzyme n=1 Tax=Psychroserpens sp. AS72 TaxID=3135775 RepID=UPI003174192B